MSKGPFARLARGYVERGFSPIPIAKPYAPLKIKGKEPGYFSPAVGHPLRIARWQRYCESPMSEDEIKHIIRDDPECGLALACGYKDLIGVDVDNVKAYPAVREVLRGSHPPTKIGRKGATAFFYGPGIKARKFREKPFRNDEGKVIRPTLVEILALGNETVIPDTIHPDTGKPYRWVCASLEDVRHPSELPAITQEHIDRLAELLAPLMPDRRDDGPRKPVRVKDAGLSAFDRRRYEGAAAAALRIKAADLAATAKPGRNDALFRAACGLGAYVLHGLLKQADLEKELVEACETNGLIADNGRGDVINTIADGLQCAGDDPFPKLKDRPKAA